MIPTYHAWVSMPPYCCYNLHEFIAVLSNGGVFPIPLRNKEIYIYVLRVSWRLYTTTHRMLNCVDLRLSWTEWHVYKKTLPPDQVHEIVNGIENLLHWVSTDGWRNSYPLILILEGTKKLIGRLHEGNTKLVWCTSS
jgi:hypothetical protein